MKWHIVGRELLLALVRALLPALVAGGAVTVVDPAPAAAAGALVAGLLSKPSVS